MPYKLRKVPKKDLYWVIAEDGKHMSKEGLPIERAKAQMRALYASEHSMKGGSIDLERYAQWAARVPLSEEKWIENRKIFSPETATHENYLKMYLEPFNKAPGLMSYKFVPGVDKGQPCPADAVVVRGYEDIAKLPPGTRYCQPNPADGSISMGSTKTQEELDVYEGERQQTEEMRARKRQAA
jgi:hypothetical protein